MPTRTARDAILDSAVDHFQCVGYHATTMRDIARSAGFTVASIYNHFPSKQRILQEIMARVLSDALSATRHAVLRSGSHPHDQVSALMYSWLVFHTERRDEALVGASEIRSLDEDGRRIIIALRDEQEGLFRDVVEFGVEEGSFTTPYPAEAARALIAMGTAVATWYRPGGELTPHAMGQRYAMLALGVVGADVPCTAQVHPGTHVHPGTAEPTAT